MSSELQYIAMFNRKFNEGWYLHCNLQYTSHRHRSFDIQGYFREIACDYRDTYKVAGAMLTKLDDGVGAVQAALEARAAPYILAFCSDNGGPLDHATNAPLKGGKHTLWDGGVRVTAWVFSPLLPPAKRGTSWGGLMHGKYTDTSIPRHTSVFR